MLVPLIHIDNCYSILLLSIIIVQVPEAIKALYSQPLEDAQHIPPITQLLLTATEELQLLRKEGERERQNFQLASSSSTALTEEQDEVSPVH